MDDCPPVPLVHTYSRRELESFLDSVHRSSDDQYRVEEDENSWDQDWPGLPEYYCAEFEQPQPQREAGDMVPGQRRLLEVVLEEEEEPGEAGDKGGKEEVAVASLQLQPWHRNRL